MARAPLVGSIGFGIEVDDSKFIQQLRRAGERGRRELQGVSTEADRMEDELRKAGAAGERAMKGLARDADRAADEMQRAQRNANALRNTVSGLALGAAFAAGVKTVAEFGQAMSTVEAVTGASGQALVALEAKAKSLGATTRFSATQAAEGMIYLARAGFNSDQVLGSIEATLQLAQAGALGLGDAADIASNILQGFQLDVSETGRLVDIMAKAANSSNTDIRQLGDAMKYVGPVATGLGVSVEETTAAVSALSDAGLQATLAGTGLRKVLLSLEVPTTRGQAALKRLGIAAEEVKVSQVGLAAALSRLKEAGLNSQDAKDIFGLIGLPAFQVLDSSIEKVERLTQAYQNAEGTAAKMAATMDDNLNGAILRAKSRMEALILALADAGAEDALIRALEGLQGLLVIAAQNADVLQAAIVALAVRAMLPLAVAIGGKVIASVVALQAQLVILTAIAGRSVGALQLATVALRGAYVALGPVTLAIAAAAAAYVALARDAEKAERAIGKADQALSKYTDTLESIDKDTNALRTAQVKLRKAIESQGPAAQATARQEVDAIQQRIDANKRLSEVYRARIAAQIAIAEKAVSAISANDIRGSNYVALKARFASDAEIRADIEAYRERMRGEIDRALANEKPLTKDQREFVIVDADRREAEERLKSLQDAYKALNDERRKAAGLGGDFRDLLEGPVTRKSDIDAATLGEAEQEALEAEMEKRARLIRDIADAEAAGRKDIVKLREDELAITDKIIEQLEAGRSIEFAQDFAKPKKAEKAGKTPEDEALKNAQREVEKLGQDYTKLYQTAREEVEAWKQTQLAAIDLVGKTEDERAALRQKVFDLEAEKLDEILIAELKADNEAFDAASRKAAAIRETLAARDDEIALQIAQARGDEAQVKALEAKMDRQRRINELLAEGLSVTEAIARADEEIARLKAGEFSKAEEARRAFVEGLSADTSAALLNAIRSGDYGNVFQEVINSSAARGLEDAVNQLADEFANFLGNIFLGANGSGGILGDVFGMAGDIAGDTGEAAAQATAAASVTGLGAAATGAATSTSALASSGASAAAAAAGLAPALAAVTLAAQSAAAALASAGTSSGASTVASALSFGGGRARGGPVQPGKFYEVNEGGIAEMLRIGRRNFLMPGAAGMVTPLATSRLPGPSDRTVAKIHLSVQGTGNQEIQRAVDAGVQRAVRIARAQAGPAAAEFQTRKV
jgi:TP901 family phage tail tape measure protein